MSWPLHFVMELCPRNLVRIKLELLTVKSSVKTYTHPGTCLRATGFKCQKLFAQEVGLCTFPTITVEAPDVAPVPGLGENVGRERLPVSLMQGRLRSSHSTSVLRTDITRVPPYRTSLVFVILVYRTIYVYTLKYSKVE